MSMIQYENTIKIDQESISILPRRIFMIRILHQEMKTYLRSIQELIFYADDESVCSYTEIPDEDDISLFLDEQSLHQYFPELVSSCGQPYRAVHVYEGAEALNMCGYINFLSASLTEQDIEVVYLSTFSTDLLLVAEEFVDQAFAHVRASLSALPHDLSSLPPASLPAGISSLEGQPAGASHLSDQSIALIYSPSSSSSSHPSSPTSSTATLASLGADGGSPASMEGDLTLSRVADAELRLLSVPRQALPSLAFYLLRVLLRAAETTDRFLSYTAVKGEITLVVEQEDLQTLQQMLDQSLLLQNAQVWSVLRVDAGASGNLSLIHI